MPKGRNHGLLIAGGGVAASLAALAMARLRPEMPFLLVADTPVLGGGRTLLFQSEGLSDEERALAEPLIAASWDGLYAAFPSGSRKLKLPCHCITPDRIEAALRAAIPAERLRLGEKIVAVRDTSLLLHGGETLLGDGALDARPLAQQPMIELGWRRAVGRLYRFAAPHRVDLPVSVDSTLEDGQGCGFFALIPFGADRLLVERVDYGAAQEPDAAAAGAAIDHYVAARGWAGGAIEREELSSQPVALGGDFEAYWRIGGARVAKLGSRGGFFHPASGSPLPDALRVALSLTRQRDFSGPALHDSFEEQATSLWKKRDFYRAFARLLLRSGRGGAVLAGLYGLDAPVVGRFETETLGLFDRRKVMAARRKRWPPPQSSRVRSMWSRRRSMPAGAARAASGNWAPTPRAGSGWPKASRKCAPMPGRCSGGPWSRSRPDPRAGR
jgi:lycopene beta-cyclase